MASITFKVVPIPGDETSLYPAVQVVTNLQEVKSPSTKDLEKDNLVVGEETRLLREPNNIDLGDGDELEMVMGRIGKRKTEEYLDSGRMKIANFGKETNEDGLVDNDVGPSNNLVAAVTDSTLLAEHNEDNTLNCEWEAEVPVFANLLDRFPDIDSLDEEDLEDEDNSQLVPSTSDSDLVPDSSQLVPDTSDSDPVPGSSQPDLVVYSDRTSDTLVGEGWGVRRADWKRDSENED